MLDIPVFQIPQLFNAAMKLSRSMGLTPQKGIKAISEGVRRQSRKILDNIGILFKRTDAYEWYSKMYGLNKLTETEKSEAWKQYAIEQIIKKAALLGKPTESELKRKQAETQQENGLIKLGEKLNA